MIYELLAFDTRPAPGGKMVVRYRCYTSSDILANAWKELPTICGIGLSFTAYPAFGNKRGKDKYEPWHMKLELRQKLKKINPKVRF